LKANARSQDTRSLLIRSATREFRLHGFAGTDTNKIARGAGFAPQTFYRWFVDKTEIFVAVYVELALQERRLFASLVQRKARTSELVDALIRFHRQHLIFRRSLRALATQVDQVREARAQSRLAQIERLEERARGAGLDRSEAAVLLLQVERLADAISEGELRDLGLTDVLARATLIELVKRLRGTKS
jgi:AcrR family transcriptional regulator